MDRNQREELERRLSQARRLALEPTDAVSRERIARFVEELERELQEKQRRRA
jgi:hypothetical protein